MSDDEQPKAYSIDLYTDGVQPRVSHLYLGRFVDRFVILPALVEIIAPDSQSMTVIDCDGGRVHVNLSRLNRHKLKLTPYVEVLGQVYREPSQGLQLLAIRITNAGDDLDLKVISRVVKLIHDERFDSIFNTNGSWTSPLVISDES